MRNGGFRLLAAVGLLAAASAAAQTVSFKYKTIDIPAAQSTQIFAINNAGVMVGSYVDSAGIRHGFKLASGKLTKVDNPKGADTYCFGINKQNAIVGYYVTSSHTSQAFIFSGAKFKDIGPHGSLSSQAIGINDHGDVTGNYADSMTVHGFLLKGSKYTKLDVPNAAFTLGGGINNAGLMTLVWIDSSNNAESSLFNGKTYKTIDVPRETDSYVGNISNVGDIVYSWESAESYGGALRHGGKFYKFHDPAGDRTFGYGINDHHAVVGAYTDSSGVTHGYEATY